MIKHYKELTIEDKKKVYIATKQIFEATYNIPWASIEPKIHKFIDDAFDDEKFPKMSSDDQVDAAYCRREFKTKPSIEDYMIWSARFVAQTEYVEVSD